MKNYKTVKKAAFDEFIERKSRFIGYSCPVSREEDAIAFINEVRARHREATHNVYAYIIREEGVMRYSDDGEPAGTAGMPVLDVLRKEDLTDICVVVTRYFGGVLLGAGGLVRAYAKGAKIGVDAAKRIERVFCDIFSVKCDYSSLGKLRYAVEENEDFILRDIVYTDLAEMIVCVKVEDSKAFTDMIVDISQGKITPTLIETDYIDKDID